MQTGSPHTPVLVQTDRPSGQGSAFSEALWREHQRRMAASLGGVGGDLPRTRVPERDPWGLRAAAALLLVTAFAFSFGPLGGRLADGFRSHSWLETVPPRIDAWVTPPAYTGKAPVFLTSRTSVSEPDAETAAPASFTVPENSELSLRVTGGSGDGNACLHRRGRRCRENSNRRARHRQRMRLQRLRHPQTARFSSPAS